jgi:hypothetical protein
MDRVRAFAKGREAGYEIDVLALDFTGKGLQEVLDVAMQEKGVGTPHYVIDLDGSIHHLVEVANRAKFVQTQEGHALVCTSYSEEGVVVDRSSVSFNSYSVSILYCGISGEMSEEQLRSTGEIIYFCGCDYGVRFDKVVTARAVVPKYYKARGIDYRDLMIDEMLEVEEVKSILEVVNRRMERESLGEDSEGSEDRGDGEIVEGGSGDVSRFWVNLDVGSVGEFGKELNESPKVDEHSELQGGVDGNFESQGGVDEHSELQGNVDEYSEDVVEMPTRSEVLKSVLRGMSFTGGQMSNATLIDCTLTEVFLRDSEVKGGTLVKCKIVDSTLSSVDIQGSKIDTSQVKDSKLLDLQVGRSELESIEIERGRIQDSRGVGIKALGVTIKSSFVKSFTIKDSILIAVDIEDGVIINTVSEGPVDMRQVEVISVGDKSGKLVLNDSDTPKVSTEVSSWEKDMEKDLMENVGEDMGENVEEVNVKLKKDKVVEVVSKPTPVKRKKYVAPKSSKADSKR